MCALPAIPSRLVEVQCLEVPDRESQIYSRLQVVSAGAGLAPHT